MDSEEEEEDSESWLQRVWKMRSKIATIWRYADKRFRITTIPIRIPFVGPLPFFELTFWRY